MLSGIGPADELRRTGYRSCRTCRASGRISRIIPAGTVQVRCYAAAVAAGGAIAGQISQVPVVPTRDAHVEWRRSDRLRPDHARLDAPDVEIIFLPVLWHDEGFTPPTEHGFTMAVMLLRPRSRGRSRCDRPIRCSRRSSRRNHLSDLADGSRDDRRGHQDRAPDCRRARRWRASRAARSFPAASATTGEEWPSRCGARPDHLPSRRHLQDGDSTR